MRTRSSATHILARLGTACLAGLLVMGASGCTPKRKLPKDREHFFFPVGQLPQEQVYGRLRPVHLPYPLPSVPKDVAAAPRILPVMQFEVKDATLEEAGMILAASARYTSYCASTIAHQRISYAGLGTIDEIAERIARQAGVNAVVDHEGRSVSFLANGSGVRNVPMVGDGDNG